MLASSAGPRVVEKGRLSHADESLATSPLPHPEHRFLRQGMSDLAREHCNLTAMVGVVSDQVSEERRYVGLEAFHSSIGLNRGLHQCEQGIPALIEGLFGLGWIYGVAVNLIWDLAALGGRFEPHHTYVVHMGDNRRDLAPFTVRWFGTPAFGGQVVDHVLVNAIVDLKGVQKRRRKYEWCSRGGLGHDLLRWEQRPQLIRSPRSYCLQRGLLLSC